MARHLFTLGMAFLLAQLLPQEAGAVNGYTKLVNAINLANKKALACVDKPTPCFGEAVTLILAENVIIEKPLPVLNYSAHLIIKGACPYKNNGYRCIIDAQLKYQVFGFVDFGPYPSLLQLYNLIFQKANGGVFFNAFTFVEGTKLVFRNNINGVVIAQGRGGYPTQLYSGCRWANNNGTVISFGSGKYGLSYNGTGLVVRRSTFYLNIGSEFYYNGGAITLSGPGTSIFENVRFIGNKASQDGGAVWASQTTVKFRGTSFSNNVAVSGGGGAVYAESNFYYGGAVSFCSCSFTGNIAPSNKAASTLLFVAQIPEQSLNKINATFCDTPIPPGSVLPASPNGTVTIGTGLACLNQHCI